MTIAALTTLILTWIITTGFTVYFFLKVLKIPQEKN